MGPSVNVNETLAPPLVSFVVSIITTELSRSRRVVDVLLNCKDIKSVCGGG